MTVDADRERAFQAFFAAHHADLARLAYLITGDANAAEDIAADSLVEIWRHWARVEAAQSPLAYARGVLANLARTWIRRQRRERLGLLTLKRFSEEFRGSDVPAVLDVRDALRRLPLRRRECLVLRYAFDVVGLERVIAEIDEGNTASAALAERLGMRPYETVPGELGPMTHYVLGSGSSG